MKTSWIRTATFSHGGYLYEAREASGGLAEVRRHGRGAARLSKGIAVALIQRDAGIPDDDRRACGAGFRLVGGGPALRRQGRPGARGRVGPASRALRGHMATLEERYGAEEAAFIKGAVTALPLDEFECVDNERTALEGDAADVLAYEDAQREGCCGFFDTRLGPSPAGRWYLYGFNHGH